MPDSAERDKSFMQRALALGELGKGSTFPNPPVGAVIVRSGRIIGEGWHQRRGEPHAERIAIQDARKRGENLEGATMFVTLEPCCHHGLTPPCSDAIIESKIGRVIISRPDSCDDRVCGRGAEILRGAGIDVEIGLLEEDGEELIEQYRVQREKRRAFISLKWAQSLDGRIACSGGDSRWITGESARREAHRLRSTHGAVAVGFKTALADNPKLTVRHIESHNTPARIVFAGSGSLPVDLNLFDGAARTIVICDPGSDPFESNIPADVEVIEIPRAGNFWGEFSEKILEAGIGSVLLEGGSGVSTSALRSAAADRIYCFIAPIILGKGIPAAGELGVSEVAGAISLNNIRRSEFDRDLLITGTPDFGESGA